MTRKNVSTAAVRTWGAANLDLIPTEGHLSIKGKDGDFKPRGRIHPTVIEAFRKANKTKTYEVKVAEAATVSFRGDTVDSIGRKTTKVVTLTVKEARALLGHEAGRKGRLSMAQVKEAWDATEANRLADQFVTAAA